MSLDKHARVVGNEYEDILEEREGLGFRMQNLEGLGDMGLIISSAKAPPMVSFSRWQPPLYFLASHNRGTNCLILEGIVKAISFDE